ncbi:glycoside hydrolase family 130 protein [Coraliomargarita sp. SDUM461004]|uniref:Glycoside hydrolase family 130 protein n=1 Tax=Thalassobacterium sedimentorum TaxID=3041258 RepID=A0ABU1AMZ6_9BACT|nr:glycoside hydrolase family 130 protein [Coraliomargarita sp. SDUM461004]MDQ8196171.1 glycoside hydrolase family 130 protein [Coraliomargarita sp. SDUM461004]
MNPFCFRKNPTNPVIEPSDFPCSIMYAFNPGAIKVGDEYLMVMDVATLAQPVVFWLARSRDGVDWKVDPEPLDWPAADHTHSEDCVYDPRVTPDPDNPGAYLLMYASSSEKTGCRLGIVRTWDFREFERIGIVSEQGNRNGVIFPEKINGKYVRLDRPFGDPNDACGIWISYSPDLIHWGCSKEVMGPRAGLWDNLKVGAGCVPIKTEKGWLNIYHGVTNTGAGLIYRLGVCLLDLEDPSIVIARGEDAVLWPEHLYELTGRVPNVVFTCNAIVEPDNSVKIYYGAADTCIGLAESSLDELLDACVRKNALVLRPL